MRTSKKILILSLVAILMMLQASILIAQEHYTTLTGTVVGVHGGVKKWLDVKSGKDEAVFNFRIGKNTVYKPHRYPNVGEKVKVEYSTHKGVHVAYTVTILEGPKESPK